MHLRTKETQQGKAVEASESGSVPEGRLEREVKSYLQDLEHGVEGLRSLLGVPCNLQAKALGRRGGEV